jgi:hypothetical protein
MAYKPPGHRPARRNPPDRCAGRTLLRQRAASAPGRPAPSSPASGRPAHLSQARCTGTAAWLARGPLRHTDRCRGNAVGAPSVKVGTAPDTPPWGQVLARHLPSDRPYRRAGSVTLRQLSESPLPLRVHRTWSGCGEPEADGVPRWATPAVWARSETPAPAMESGLTPRLPARGIGQASNRQARRAGERETGDSPRPGSAGMAKLQYLARPIRRVVTPGRPAACAAGARSLGRTPRERHHRTLHRLLRYL